MLMPVFSAAYSDRIRDLDERRSPGNAGMQWRRVEISDPFPRRGYVLEEVSPNLPASSDEESQDSDASPRSPPGFYKEHRHSYDPGTQVVSSSRTGVDAMTVTTHTWISLWFLITVPVIFWDVGYCFMRPRSMVGGDLHWLWKPYEIYQEIDYVYGLPSFESGDGFPNAQSLLNVVETFINIWYLYLAHVAGSTAAPLVGFSGAIMTLSKTVLYWAQEYYCNGCSVGHNSARDLFVYWIIPNGMWLLVPTLIVAQLSKDIMASLSVAETASKKVTATEPSKKQ